MDSKERSDSFRRAVLDILRTEYGEDVHRKNRDELVASEVALLYTKRENEFMKYILDSVKKDFGLSEESEG